jgi:nickel superoxide dismutase
MKLSGKIMKSAGMLGALDEVSAHCDIPCGIYDPHLAQLAAHTVIRMIDLIEEQVPPGPDATPEQIRDYTHGISRYMLVKEEHAELCKHEIRIMWGDYIKPDMVEEHPEVHGIVWEIMRLGSIAKQDVDIEHAEELLDNVHKFAEIFWATKGVETKKVKSAWPSGHEVVLPDL